MLHVILVQRSVKIVLLLLSMLLAFSSGMAFDRTKAIKLFHKLKCRVDSADIKGTDTIYLRLPHEGFVANLTSTFTGSNFGIEYELPEVSDGSVTLSGNLRSKVSNIYSLGVSYRGWGLSYSRDLMNHGDNEFTFTLYGQTYGFQARLRETNTLSGELTKEIEGSHIEPVLSVDLREIRQQSLVANGYYVFNHRRFSLPAAMSNTIIQRRSAGSFLAILNYHYMKSMFYDSELSYVMSSAFEPQDVQSRLRDVSQMQFSLGGGYAYNYAFANEQCLLHGAFMPMVSIWHRNRTYWDVTEHNEQGLVVAPIRHEEYAISQKPFAFNAYLNLSFVYNSGRYLTGLLGNSNLDTLPCRNGLTIFTIDWSARLFVGVRF